MTAQLTSAGTQASAGTRAWTPERAGRGWLRKAWHRTRLALRDMNYGARRAVEVQAPWIVDERWHSK